MPTAVGDATKRVRRAADSIPRPRLGRPRRFLLVFVHPMPTSFVAALADAAEKALLSSGHAVRRIDLYGEGFNPRLSVDEWRDRENAAAWTEITPHVEALRWADGLVFVYPTWFGSQPAMLKGWFDRVWAEGVAYRLPPAGRNNITGLLRQIRSIDVITTHGSGKVMNSVQGEPGKRLILRGLRSLCSWKCRARWHAFYGNDTATHADRTSFLDHITAVMGRL